MANFKDLNVNENLIVALKDMNIESPRMVQEKAIPQISEGIDLMVESHTGSGKTLAYILPLIEKVNYEKRENQFIILVPTHELALQVNEVIKELAIKSELPLTSTVIMGDINIKRQIEKLKEKPQFVIGSPGRILELIKLKKISAHTVKTIVVDECDKLLEENNIESVKAVIKTTLRDRQVLMFSATLTEECISSAKALMKEAEIVKCSDEVKVNPNLTHLYIVCEKRDKVLVLRKLMASLNPKKAIGFINTTHEIEALTEKLKFHDLKVDGIHGSFIKNERRKTMSDFKLGKINLLISSDLSSRGLDIQGVSYIFNIDLPEDVNVYLHRSGRAARGDGKGTVISIVAPSELKTLNGYMNKLNINISERTLSQGRVVEVKSVVKTPVASKKSIVTKNTRISKKNSTGKKNTKTSSSSKNARRGNNIKKK